MRMTFGKSQKNETGPATYFAQALSSGKIFFQDGLQQPISVFKPKMALFNIKKAFVDLSIIKFVIKGKFGRECW